MTETLLSPSNVLLFGRIVEDLRIVRPTRSSLPIKVDYKARVVVTEPILMSAVPTAVDGKTLANTDRVLLVAQADPTQNGIYVFAPGPPPTLTKTGDDLSAGKRVRIQAGKTNGKSIWESTTPDASAGQPISFMKLEQGGEDERHGPFIDNRAGTVGQLEGQLVSDHSSMARIYGFSFEGTYYELARPALFLVHGDGIPASAARRGIGAVNQARAPGDPSRTGIAAADFQFADDLRVWSYDKADYTIRMDVETGMFEDVLLAAFFGDGYGVSGAKVSGAKISGAKISGSRIAGAKISGAKLSGGRGDASD